MIDSNVKALHKCGKVITEFMEISDFFLPQMTLAKTKIVISRGSISSGNWIQVLGINESETTDLWAWNR